MRLVLSLALLSGGLFGQQIQTMARQGAGTSFLPIATIHSTRGLIVNGVRTPPGVTSAIVAAGDTVSTGDGVSTAKFADGRTVTLLPGTSYLIPMREPVRVGSSPIAPITPIAVGTTKKNSGFTAQLGALSIHKP